MKKYYLSILLSALSCIATAQTFQPNSVKFTCPDGDQIDTSKKIYVSVGERPGGFGECFWRNPEVSFNLSDDGKSVTGITTWKLDGGWLADGCSDIKGEMMSSIGVIARVSCKAQQQ